MRRIRFFGRRYSEGSGAAVSLAVVLSLATSIMLHASPSASAPSMQSDDIACTAPDLVSLSPERVETEVFEASPIASPVASPEASPVAIDDIGRSDNLLTSQIERSLQGIAVCQSERRVKALTRYVTDDFLSDVYAGGGSITREQFVGLGYELPRVPVEILEVTSVEADSPGNATAVVVWTVSRQLFHGEWEFVFVADTEGDQSGDEGETGRWLADGINPLPVEVPEDARETKLTIDNNAYDPNALRVRGPDFVISADNKGESNHELLVLAFDDNVTIENVLRDPGPALPDGVTVIGQLTIPAGEEGDLVLVGVEKGSYVIVDLLPDANGTPHLALGMRADLTVR